jgi:hypothetical protein
MVGAYVTMPSNHVSLARQAADTINSLRFSIHLLFFIKKSTDPATPFSSILCRFGVPVTTVAWVRRTKPSCRKLSSRWVVFGDGDGALVSIFMENILMEYLYAIWMWM